MAGCGSQSDDMAGCGSLRRRHSRLCLHELIVYLRRQADDAEQPKTYMKDTLNIALSQESSVVLIL